jgi:hypothetical protein
MTRLCDRAAAYGFEAFRPYHLATETGQAELRAASRRNFLEGRGAEITDEKKRDELADYLGSAQFQVSNAPISTEVFPSTALQGIPVFAADEVGAYCEELPVGTRVTDVVTTVAPPFERYWIEFQGVANPMELHAWGWLFGITDAGESEEIGWHVGAHLVIEKRKNEPIGPVINMIYALDRQGRLMTKDGADELIGGVWFPPMKPEAPPPEVVKDTGDKLMRYMLPAQMATSLMHCKNVEVREVEPPVAQARSWEKRRGAQLATYHVLEIGPMRELLEGEGESQAKGLRHALHIARGHFKTFNEEAPLFGQRVGTYWWADQVRGRAEEGERVKDYEVRVPGVEFARPYEAADEEPDLAQAERTGPDPDVAGRGLAAHNRTQNLLAQAVEAAGYSPRRPGEEEPNFDLAWEAGEEICVAEVKSLTPQSEERQLRMALGQVSRYRQLLAHQTGSRVRALIATEYEPADASWLELAEEQAITLCWPETFAAAVKAGSLGA